MCGVQWCFHKTEMKTLISSKNLTFTSSCWAISPTACFNKDSFISVCLPFQKLGEVEIKTTLCTVKNDISECFNVIFCIAKLYRTSVKEFRLWVLLFKVFFFLMVSSQEMHREIVNLSKDQRSKIAWREKHQGVYNMHMYYLCSLVMG